MKLLSTANEMSMNGMWLFFLILVAAVLILVLWQVRQNRRHARQLRELYDMVGTLREWCGAQGENVEFLKTRLPFAPVGLPNAAHTPAVERATQIMMAAGVGYPRAYELIYKTVHRGDDPEAFATTYAGFTRGKNVHASIH
jgi:hypothetical protein